MTSSSLHLFSPLFQQHQRPLLTNSAAVPSNQLPLSRINPTAEPDYHFKVGKPATAATFLCLSPIPRSFIFSSSFVILVSLSLSLSLLHFYLLYIHLRCYSSKQILGFI